MEVGDLLRFSHCGSTVVTLATEAIARCPVCGQVPRFRLAEAPVRIRSPVRDGHRATCCFLVASQHGLPGLSKCSDSELHVGVSNSKGVVFSYTESGVQRQQEGWIHSIVIPLVAPDNHIPSFTLMWDRQLEVFAAMETWTPDRFQEEREFGSCCYGFALGFINQVLRSQGNQPISREHFTSQYVLPRVENTSRYLSAYQHICRHGYTVLGTETCTLDVSLLSDFEDVLEDH